MAHGATVEAGEEAGASGDLLASLNRLYARALLDLGRAGEGEAACRLAGQGWALLRRAAPREAERLNGVLHALTRAPVRSADTNEREGEP